MRITVSDQPSGRLTDAGRHCVGTGRFELALRRDYQDSLALIQRDIGHGGYGLLTHRQIKKPTYHLYAASEEAGNGGRVEVDLTLSRHEVTLLELSAVVDETPPWWNADRLLGPPVGSDRKEHL
ncbi:hypothetical protein [Micromonospora sp. LH3U1]|uniref:hypothetical protein n=1 Tax=Micromonospora sp. LH3U1 TaxID=3018339 RepID=UPI00234A7595|nr:hypothetical protein [Micromonospora sp. LH3U1]WCN79119.1 hypothetical protein PCA76_19060 [Micromonospora sp. LH3U1]